MYCPHCGSNIEIESCEYCPRCGKRINAVQDGRSRMPIFLLGIACAVIGVLIVLLLLQPSLHQKEAVSSNTAPQKEIVSSNAADAKVVVPSDDAMKKIFFPEVDRTVISGRVYAISFTNSLRKLPVYESPNPRYPLYSDKKLPGSGRSRPQDVIDFSTDTIDKYLSAFDPPADDSVKVKFVDVISTSVKNAESSELEYDDFSVEVSFYEDDLEYTCTVTISYIGE